MVRSILVGCATGMSAGLCTTIEIAEGPMLPACEWRLQEGCRMRPYTAKEKLRISAGAVASLVIVGWAVVLALAFLSAR
jgi:hypothetical protein